MNTTTSMPPTTFAQPRMQPRKVAKQITPRYIASSDLKPLAARFAPISLKQMDSVALLNRIDTKYVMFTSQLLTTLTEIQDEYCILTIDGQQLNHYRTLYYDTPDFAFYNAHVNGQAERYKVRSREYTDTNLSFLEVKHKTRKDRTIKKRISLPKFLMKMTSDMEKWLQGVFPLDGRLLEPKLWNTFIRMTLVSKKNIERVTLDVDLRFFTADKSTQLEGIAIAEVKMDSGNRASAFLAQMRAQKIRQQGFSKYSMGVSMLYDQVKKNALKPKMLWLEKVMKGNFCYE